ncbi:MAG TPA: SusC/RagA family TonB-linked outer membrane protein [Gemmatimonadaceae bacterium]|nr:SusC/RagA family TonB-linked outer membrane protein [Gemmatimonadaceae bacterium]
MRKVGLSLFLSFLALGVVSDALAQRLVTGRVASTENNEPLAGASVVVVGSALGTYTGDDGSYSLNVPQDSVTLRVRRLGYKGTDVPLPIGRTSANVTLERDVLELEAQIVTGQATTIERRNLANAVALVNSADVNRVPQASVENALQGKVAGAVIQTNSGAPGGGVQVRLRGITSINASSEPLYVVDGVVVSNVAIPSNQNAITRAASGSNPSLDQDAQVNRIADLVPGDMETVEVLKGAAASAIYGSRAANGVVLITTRRGRPGAAQFNVTQRFGWSELSNTLGSRRFDSVDEAVDVWGPAAANFFQSGRVFDHERELADRKPLLSETGLDVSGGNENTRYYASGLVKHDGGIIANTGYDKQSLRLNLDQRFGSRVDVGLSTNLIRTKAQRGLTNNDNASVSFYMVFPFTPSFVDLQPGADGLFPCNPFVGNCSNPLQTASLMTNDETVWRYVSGARIVYQAVESPSHSLRITASGGADYFAQDNNLIFPPELNFEPSDGEPGTILLSNSNNLDVTVSGNVVYGYRPAGGSFRATTSIGGGYADRDLDIARITSRNIVGGRSIVGTGTNVQAIEQRQRVKTGSIFAQEEFLFLNERALLTAGINADQSSVNGDDGKLFFYPKVSGSYRLLKPFGGLDELKLRAAYGEAGNQPLFGQKFTPLTITQNINGLPGIVTQGTVGSPGLEPERQREIEAGLDATFSGGRATLEVTAFRKSVTNLLLQRTLAPSSGFELEIFNGGKLRTQGVEAGLGVVPVRTDDLQWISRATFFVTRSKIIDLPVPTFRTGGFGTALGAFEIEEGASATQIVGNDTLSDGTPVVRKIGDATPDFNMSFANEVTFKGFHLYGLVDWQQGSDLINLTKFLYDLGQNSADFATPIVVGGDTTTVGARRLDLFGRQTAVYLEDASFVKLREVTLSYELPSSMVSRMLGGKVDRARLSVSGRNLLTFTDYDGLDPEVSNFGNQNIARNIDVAPFPPSRSFWFSLEVGF